MSEKRFTCLPKHRHAKSVGPVGSCVHHVMLRTPQARCCSPTLLCPLNERSLSRLCHSQAHTISGSSFSLVSVWPSLLSHTLTVLCYLWLFLPSCPPCSLSHTLSQHPPYCAISGSSFSLVSVVLPSLLVMAHRRSTIWFTVRVPAYKHCILTQTTGGGD